MARGAKKAFTEEGVAKMAAPRGTRREIGDAVQRGLVLRVGETGVKSWSVIYKVPGERGISPTGRPLKGAQKRITIGQFPIVGVAAAREEAGRVIRQALAGKDPRPERRDANLLRHTNSVEAVSKRMVELAKKQIESWPKVEQILTEYVWPTLGSRPIADVTQADIHKLLDDLVAQERHGTAREVRKMMSRLLNYAAEKSLVPASPMAGMKRRDLTLQVSERALTDEELRAVWAASEEMAYPFGHAFQLLMLTGQRKSDWGDAQRVELDAAEQWLSIPLERFKSRRGHVVPLVGTAWDIAAALPTWVADDDATPDGELFLFSTTGGKRPVSGWSKAKARLDELALKHLRKARKDPEATLSPFVIHDFRRTCETRLARLGFNQEVRDAVLGHAKAGLQRTYNKYDYLAEKRAALDAYGAHIMGLLK
jgi:integrase